MPKILLIEDDPDQILMYQAKFELEGFEFLATKTGEEGIKIAKEEAPDLILLDLLLVHEDGVDVLRKLKEDGQTKDIPVVVLTNYAKKGLAEQTKEMGAIDFWIKSQFFPSEIVRKVREILK